MQTNEQPQQSALCSMCHTFFGSSKTDGLCSSCYKLHHPEKPTQTAVIKEQIMEDVKETPKETAPIVKPIQPKAKCHSCGMKVGYLGYSCKCGYTYCGKHRYSDMHNCTYDYKTEAKEKISKANPAVVAEKLNKL
jgi:hypothetical protein